MILVHKGLMLSGFLKVLIINIILRLYNLVLYLNHK